MKDKLIILFVIFAFLTLNLYPLQAETEMAEAFNPNFIISDDDLVDYDSMTAKQIQDFLTIKESYLANYSTTDADGMIRSAADIIWLAANTYKINPKYLLVLLQKEQSLITDQDPSEHRLAWATGYAVCDSCKTDDPLIQKFKGFGKQVDRAAWRNRYYIEHPNEFKWQVGETYDIDDVQVTIYNQGTANLYIYTPHIHGNYNFWKIWNHWFSRTYPDGSLLKLDDEPGIWLIKNGQRRPFLTKSAFTSRYDINKVITVSRNDLAQFEIGPALKFPQYSLLQNENEEIYLIVDDFAKLITSQEVFRTIGFNPEEIIEIENEELAAYEIGEDITMDSVYPTGGLLQDKTTGGIYYVESGKKYPIWSREIMQANFSSMVVQTASPEELSEFNTYAPVKFRDGELIMSNDSPRVYVVSQGKRLPIVSAEVFEEIGYKWENIITTTPQAVKLHRLGQEINTFLHREPEPEDVPKTTKTPTSSKAPAPSAPVPAEAPVNNLDDRMSIEAYK